MAGFSCFVHWKKKASFIRTAYDNPHKFVTSVCAYILVMYQWGALLNCKRALAFCVLGYVALTCLSAPWHHSHNTPSSKEKLGIVWAVLPIVLEHAHEALDSLRRLLPTQAVGRIRFPSNPWKKKNMCSSRQQLAAPSDWQRAPTSSHHTVFLTVVNVVGSDKRRMGGRSSLLGPA